MLDMEIVWGKTKSFRLTVKDRDGNLINLDTKTLRFNVRDKTADLTHLLSLATGAGITHDAAQSTTGKGFATLKVLPTNTTSVAAFNPGSTARTFNCELELIQVANEPEILDVGFFTVLPAVRETL